MDDPYCHYCPHDLEDLCHLFRHKSETILVEGDDRRGEERKQNHALSRMAKMEPYLSNLGERDTWKKKNATCLWWIWK